MTENKQSSDDENQTSEEEQEQNSTEVPEELKPEAEAEELVTFKDLVSYIELSPSWSFCTVISSNLN